MTGHPLSSSLAFAGNSDISVSGELVKFVWQSGAQGRRQLILRHQQHKFSFR